MGKISMPYNKDRENNQNQSTSQKGIEKLFSPLPNKAREKHNNGVLIPIFYPGSWRIFNPTPGDVSKFGLVSGNSPLSIPADLSSFYFKIPVHGVSNYSRADGSVGFSSTICPIHFNKYLTEVLGFGPLFASPRCAFCEEEQVWWNKYNARFEELGYTAETKKGLTKEQYKSLTESDPVLKNSREKARKLKVQDKYALPIFDYDQFAGVKPLREGQASVEHQIWFASQGVFEKLATMCDISPDGQEFYTMDNPQGVQVLYIVKDTMRCTPGNLLQTQYDVIQGPRVQIDPTWLAYVQSREALVDPSDFLGLVTYEEQRYYLSSEAQGSSTGGSVSSPRNPVAPPSPPVAASAPVDPVVPPVVPPVAASAPVAPPVPASPVAPPMPVPAPSVASPVPAQAPASPVPASPIPVVPQAQGVNRTPPKNSPPPGRRAW